MRHRLQKYLAAAAPDRVARGAEPNDDDELDVIDEPMRAAPDVRAVSENGDRSIAHSA
jgi:hypothetical protein